MSRRDPHQETGGWQRFFCFIPQGPALILYMYIRSTKRLVPTAAARLRPVQPKFDRSEKLDEIDGIVDGNAVSSQKSPTSRSRSSWGMPAEMASRPIVDGYLTGEASLPGGAPKTRGGRKMRLSRPPESRPRQDQSRTNNARECGKHDLIAWDQHMELHPWHL